MVTFEIGRHKVEMYDGIEELPIVRFHKYQKLLLIEAGIGSDLSALDNRLDKARRFLADGKADKAQQELENLRQCVNLIQQGINPKQLAFAVLVKSIDGKESNDISDDALNALLKKLNDTPVSRLAARLGAVKKKIDTELNVYFPRLFNDSETKEYYDIVKKRTLAILNGIISGVADPAATDAVAKLTNDLILYAKPKAFAGSDGVDNVQRSASPPSPVPSYHPFPRVCSSTEGRTVGGRLWFASRHWFVEHQSLSSYGVCGRWRMDAHCQCSGVVAAYRI